ncbi:MAG: hypothetical protein K2I36_00535 [Ureaplasma sp.]|nr:hypothetical protein [Ureaplasma sp.]
MEKDLYTKWNEEGQLQENLIIISMLVKSGITERQIAKYYLISFDEIKLLKKKYFDFAYALDKDNICELVECFKTLKQVAHGYSKKIPRKQFYKNRKGEDKATLQEVDAWFEPDVKSVQYILEKFFGPNWRNDSETLKLAEKKIASKKEEWSNGNLNEGNWWD